MYSTRRINRLIRGWTAVTNHQSRHKTTGTQKRALVPDGDGASVSTQEENTDVIKEKSSNSSSRSVVVNVETQQKTFLQPHVNPYGVWEKWAYKGKRPPTPSNRTEDQEQSSGSTSYKPLASPWTLAERRALFMYHRALAVAVKQEPDWDFVGSRLDRDPANCKIVSSYITSSWLGHMDKRGDHIYSGRTASRLSILAKMTVGVAFGQLRSLANIAQQQGIDGGQLPPSAAAASAAAVVDGSAVNSETLGWLLKLVAPPCEDILWTTQTVNEGQWTDFEDQQFTSECPVLRHPTVDDFPIHTARWCRSPKSIIKRYRQLVDAELIVTPKRKSLRIKPLTPDEISIIEQAKKTCSPRDLRWADIRDKLGENRRSFAQIILLTTCYPLK
ncbi:hypothetical protein H4S06_000904 [Coemansia sp. BCRC 34490]|nr:hypothetical protein H4S06_000904 [Coemansia sp. BCRC 34490]